MRQLLQKPAPNKHADYDVVDNRVRSLASIWPNMAASLRLNRILAIPRRLSLGVRVGGVGVVATLRMLRNSSAGEIPTCDIVASLSAINVPTADDISLWFLYNKDIKRYKRRQ